jgi:hypothetical protein
MDKVYIYEIEFKEINLNIKIYSNEIFPKSKYRKFMKMQYNRDSNDFTSIFTKTCIVV